MSRIHQGGGNANVKVFDLTRDKNIPDWVPKKQRRELSKDEDYRKRIDLVQDFTFPTSSQRIKYSRDQNHIIATGTYPPKVKVFDVRDVSLKFERHLDSIVVQFEILSDDYTKLAFLGNDRTISFHAAFGSYDTVRIPAFGRDTAYDRSTCDLFVASASSDIYRFNLDEGRFRIPLSPIKGSDDSGGNVLSLCEQFRLLSCGKESGIVECWDLRSRRICGALNPSAGIPSEDLDDIAFQGINGVTALAYSQSGMQLAVGMSSGHCSVYDIRSAKPLCVKAHQFGLPIVSIAFQEPGEHIFSADSKCIKVWSKESGKLVANIETESAINSFVVVPGPSNSASNSAAGNTAAASTIGEGNKPVSSQPVSTSGLIFAAVEQERMLAYYVPHLGPAPKWASFLDSLTEELEESKDTTIWDDYKFVTKAELEELGLSHLLGTNLLRSYMHGYFIDIRLYERVRSVTRPESWEEYRKNKIREKLESKRAQRIQSGLPSSDSKKKDTNVKVNKRLAERLLEMDEPGVDGSSLPRKSKKSNASAALKDERFGALFNDPDFEVDEKEIKDNPYEQRKNKKQAQVSHDTRVVTASEVIASKKPANKNAPILPKLMNTASQAAKPQDKIKSSAIVSSDNNNSDLIDILGTATSYEARKKSKEEKKLKSLPLKDRLKLQEMDIGAENEEEDDDDYNN